MSSPESRFNETEPDPRLTEILARFGDILVTEHGMTMTVTQAQTECPPFIDALLRAESLEQAEQIINIFRAR